MKSTPSAPEEKQGGKAPVIRSAELLGGNREVMIEHGESLYRLMVTKAGKLILTK